MVRTSQFQARTRVRYDGYTSLQEDIRRGIVDTADTPNNPYSVAIRRWGEIYREFLKRRYNRYKAGGGDWAAIGKATIKWRKYRHGITHRQILYVTRALYKTTNKKYKTAAGQYEKRTKYGITVGVSSEKHPDSGLSFHRLVAIHASGEVQRKPTKSEGAVSTERVIYDTLDQPTKDKMTASMRLAHRKALNKANNKIPKKRST